MLEGWAGAGSDPGFGMCWIHHKKSWSKKGKMKTSADGDGPKVNPRKLNPRKSRAACSPVFFVYFYFFRDHSNENIA